MSLGLGHGFTTTLRRCGYGWLVGVIWDLSWGLGWLRVEVPVNGELSRGCCRYSSIYTIVVC